MKIGILTFHRSINNGALIQCYALVSRLKKDFPCDIVEVIDYDMPKVAEEIYPDTLVKYYSGANLRIFLSKTKRLLLNPSMLNRQKEKNKIFKQAVSILPLSKKRIVSNGTDELFQYINTTYDVVIVGSDAIWNYSLRGFPNPYFLDSSIIIPKFSYAASCYGLNYERTAEEQKQKIADILESYTFIGTRDIESEKYLKFIGCSKEPVHTCDPTLLLDMEHIPINHEELVNKLKARHFAFDGKTIGVMGTNEMCKMVKAMYGEKYQIVALFNYCRSADVNLFDLTPYEWAYVFRYFALTFTTYFHGTLLSLKNGTPVICVALDNTYNKNHMAKAYDFLQRIDMTDCYFDTDYKALNIKEIKAKADILINNADIKDSIRDKISVESKTYNIFISTLSECINE